MSVRLTNGKPDFGVCHNVGVIWSFRKVLLWVGGILFEEALKVKSTVSCVPIAVCLHCKSFDLIKCVTCYKGTLKKFRSMKVVVTKYSKTN